ncbi:unnamed protein product [Cladocopium goreaui]|uniref:Uncharacterized protein n=1 Tax=Cladocopium goreaui TaxID=2562237 RepID=A0A9P1FJ90_9DINO|nr:unnamed protein product [Cladocopium goreaui]
MAAIAATLRLARPARPEGFCPQVPEAVQALLDATEGIWSDGSSSSSSEDPPQASRSSTAPVPHLPVPGAPPGLEGERVVRRVSRQKLQVPGQTAARRSNFLTTPASSGRSVTISDGGEVPTARSAAPRLLPRSFTTEPVGSRSHEATQWSTEQLRQQMAQLQQLQQLQLQQISQYDLQQQRALLQQFQMTQMQQMRAQSLREPTPQRPQTDDVDPKALRRTVSAAPAEPVPADAASPGGRRRRKSMRQVAQEVTAAADSEAEMQLEAGPEDVEIIVGPTDHAVLPLSFEETPGQAAQNSGSTMTLWLCGVVPSTSLFLGLVRCQGMWAPGQPPMIVVN